MSSPVRSPAGRRRRTGCSYGHRIRLHSTCFGLLRLLRLLPRLQLFQHLRRNGPPLGFDENASEVILVELARRMTMVGGVQSTRGPLRHWNILFPRPVRVGTVDGAG
jgi:hypothetical protein